MRHHLHLSIHPLIYPSVVLWDCHGLCVGPTEWQLLANAMSLCLRSTRLVQLVNCLNWTFRDMFSLKHKSKNIIVPSPVPKTQNWVLCRQWCLAFKTKEEIRVTFRERAFFILQRSAELMLSALGDNTQFSSSKGRYQTFMEHWVLI